MIRVELELPEAVIRKPRASGDDPYYVRRIIPEEE